MLNFGYQKIRDFFGEVWFLWSACLILNIITFFLVYFKLRPSGIQALRYNVLVGVEWYGSGANLYFIPGIGLAIAGLNFALYRSLRGNDNFLSFLSAFVSLAVQLILLSGVAFLASVN